MQAGYGYPELDNWVEALFPMNTKPSMNGRNESGSLSGSTTQTHKGETGVVPDVYLTEDAARWLRGFVHHVDTEIGGFGYCTMPADGVIVIDTILLAPQEVSSGGVDFKDDAMVYMIEKAAEDGRSQDARVSWHSHVNMGTFWSPTDEDGIRDYSHSGMPWLVSLVANKKNEIKGRLDVFNVDIVGHASFKDGITVRELRDNSIDDEVKKEVEYFVTEKKKPEKKEVTTTTYKGGQKTGTRTEGKDEKGETSTELTLKGPLKVDSTMEPEEFLLVQKFLSGEELTNEETQKLDIYLEGGTPEVVDGEVVVLG